MSSSNSTALFSSPLFPPFLDPKSWYPSPYRTTSPRPWFLPVTLCSFIFSSLLPRKTRLWIATPALLLLISQARVSSTGDVAKDFGRGTLLFGWLLKWIDYGMLVKDGELWKVGDRRGQKKDGDRDEKGRRKKEVETGVWQRFKGIVELWMFNMRGIGWNWEVGGIPDQAPQSKSYAPPSHLTHPQLTTTSYFLFRTALRVLGSYIILDLTKFLSSQIPYIHLSPRPSFFALPVATQVLLTWLHQLEAFTFINIPYQLTSFLLVLTSIHPPESWPPLFGSLSDAYLVSRAWGRTWHQVLRRPLGLLTSHAQHWLGVKARGAKRSVSLACSFFLSGLLHWSGCLNLPWTESAAGMFWYFIMQAPVIRLEDYAVEFGGKRGISSSRKFCSNEEMEGWH